ncbi:MAG: hypothetical protein ABIH03_10700, partial [Pseudomonadota bacterium]
RGTFANRRPNGLSVPMEFRATTQSNCGLDSAAREAGARVRPGVMPHISLIRSTYLEVSEI